MAKKKSAISQLPLNVKIEVRLTKQMQYGDYLKILKKSKEQGWRVEAFQIGFNK